MKEIIINSPKYGIKKTQVDDEDFDFLNSSSWHVRKDTHGFYVVRNGKYYNGKRSPIIMHRVIMNASCNQMIDHADGNGLNNQKYNLRFCNDQQNAANRKKVRLNKTGYRGITERKGRYMVRFSINNKRKSIGTFDFLNDAINEYNIAAKKYNGEFAVLNEMQ